MALDISNFSKPQEDPSELPGSVVSGGSTTAPLSGSVTFLPLPTGVAATDTANLNTVLAAGGRIRPNPLALTASYSLTAPLILAPGGNTDVDFGGCTFLLLGTYNFLQNAVVAPTFTATDATTNVDSSVVTSATLAPHAVAGMQLAVVAAGYTGGDGAGPTWLYGTVASVAGNNITLTGNVNGVKATFALTGATAYLWTTRDANITVAGGTWNAGSIWTVGATRYANANNTSFLRFRRVDGLTVRDQTFVQQTFTGALGWCFGVDPADCTDVLIERIVGQNASTCVQGTGPLARVIVRGLRGQTQDDHVAFGCTSATGADTEGDITDVLIEQVLNSNAYCAVDLFSGKGNHNAVRYLDATVRGIKGTTQLHSVRVQDYAGVGQVNVRIEDVTARPGAGQQAVANLSSTGRISTVPAGVFEPSDSGFLAATCDPLAATGTFQIGSGFLYAAMLKVPYMITVANLWLCVTTAGVTLTANQCLAGIYDSQGSLWAKTADQSAVWTALGWKSMALTAQGTHNLTLPGGPGVFYWVIVLGQGTTLPFFAADASAAGLVQPGLGNSYVAAIPGAKHRVGYDQTGARTALPASIAGDNMTDVGFKSLICAAVN